MWIFVLQVLQEGSRQGTAEAKPELPKQYPELSKNELDAGTVISRWVWLILYLNSVAIATYFHWTWALICIEDINAIQYVSKDFDCCQWVNWGDDGEKSVLTIVCVLTPGSFWFLETAA